MLGNVRVLKNARPVKHDIIFDIHIPSNKLLFHKLYYKVSAFNSIWNCGSSINVWKVMARYIKRILFANHPVYITRRPESLFAIEFSGNCLLTLMQILQYLSKRVHQSLQHLSQPLNQLHLHQLQECSSFYIIYCLE